MVANDGPPRRDPENVMLEVWLDEAARVVAAILTRRDQRRDDEGQQNREDSREDR